MKNILVILAVFVGTIAVKAQGDNYLNTNFTPIYPVGSPFGTNAGFGINALNNGSIPGTNYGGCTAFGFEVMPGEFSGNNNSGAGTHALYNNAYGSDNVAVGYEAMYLNDQGGYAGDNNTAVGCLALRDNTDGDNNTAIGFESLRSNDIGQYSTAMGYRSLRNNSSVLLWTRGDNNTALGTDAMRLGGCGNNNAAIGYQALEKNDRGEENTALGSKALANNGFNGITYGMYNTGLGVASLNSNIAGNYNTGVGFQSLYLNTDAFYGTAVGQQAMYSNTTGKFNVAVGTAALYNNLTGEGNTALGEGAMFSSKSNYNVAVGYQAIYNLSSTAANGNIAIGTTAFASTGVCNFNTILGANSHPGNSKNNTTVLGSGFTSNFSNSIWLGNTTCTLVEGQVLPVSDGRFKTNVKEDVIGLDFILNLKPVQYNFDYLKYDHFINATKLNEEQRTKIDNQLSKNSEIRQTGFLAQQVEQLADSLKYNFNGVYRPKNNTEAYGLSYELFVVPLVKAVQEQQLQIEKLVEETKEIENMIDVPSINEDKPVVNITYTLIKQASQVEIVFLSDIKGLSIKICSEKGSLLGHAKELENKHSFTIKSGTGKQENECMVIYKAAGKIVKMEKINLQK